MRKIDKAEALEAVFNRILNKLELIRWEDSIKQCTKDKAVQDVRFQNLDTEVKILIQEIDE